MIIDNKTSGKVGDTLSGSLMPETKLFAVTGAFSIFGFDAINQHLNKIQNARLIITQLHQLAVPGGKQSGSSVSGDKFEIRLRNELKQAKIARARAQWVQQKAQVSTTKQNDSLKAA